MNDEGFFVYGSPTWARTRDTRINSPLLYQLSYWRIIGNNDKFHKGFNKRYCLSCLRYVGHILAK